MEELLDEALAKGPLDVIRDLGEPLPAIVIAELLGVPAADHRAFKQWSTALIEAIPQAPFQGAAGIDEKAEVILRYLRGVIADRRRAPGDDLISGMIEAQEERDALTDQELLATSFLLLLAGHETTTNLIGNGTLALLRNPEQLARLRAEPALLENAVEELLRYDSPVQATVRVATEDVELGGQKLPAERPRRRAASARRTATRRCTRTPTASTSPARTSATSPSASARTSASARRSRASRRASPSRACSRAARTSASPARGRSSTGPTWCCAGCARFRWRCRPRAISGSCAAPGGRRLR